MKKYKIEVSEAQYICKDGTCDWMEENTDSKIVGSFKTLKECFEDMENWGSRWVMYPSTFITTDKDGEIWSSIPALTKCDSCGHEEWDTVEGFSLPEYKEMAQL